MTRAERERRAERQRMNDAVQSAYLGWKAGEWMSRVIAEVAEDAGIDRHDLAQEMARRSAEARKHRAKTRLNTRGKP